MLKTKKLIAASAAALTVFGAAALLPKGAAGLMRPAAADTAVDASFNISECSVTIPYASYTYRGRGIQPTVTVTDAEGSKLVQDADYTVTYSNNTNVGTASIIVKGKGNYSGFLTKNFTVKPLDLSSSYAKVTIPYASYTYTGKAITPEVRVKFKDGGLIASGEYSLSYSDNTGVGNAYITVKGTSKNVIGTYKKAFVVKPAKNAIQSLTTTPGAFKVTWKKATPGAVGYQVKYSTDKNFVKNVHSYTSTDLSDLSENFSKVPNGGETWYVKVRSFVTKDGKAESTRYGNYSAVKSIKVAEPVKDLDPDEIPAEILSFVQNFGGYTNNGTAEYDSSKPENVTPGLISQIVSKNALFDAKYYPVDAPQVGDKDPLGRFAGGYAAMPKEDVLWVLQNILGVSRSKADVLYATALKDTASFYERKSGGKVYLYHKKEAAGTSKTQTAVRTVIYDGSKYYVVYDRFPAVYKAGDRCRTFYAEMTLKKVSGKKCCKLLLQTETLPKLPAASKSTAGIYGKFAGSYTFSSGSGSWSSTLTLNSSGTFSGVYSDLSKTASGKNYDSTLTYSKFTGKFKNPRKVNNYIYAFDIDYIKYETKPGTNTVKNRQRINYTDAFGIAGTKTVYAYTADAPVSVLPESFFDWTFRKRGTKFAASPLLSYVGLYASDIELGWS